MKLSEFKNALALHPGDALAFVLPGGSAVPAHAHVTEVGRAQKIFLDCGGKRRESAFCSLQIWVADDLDHRLPAGKLAGVIDGAREILDGDDLEMQVECQADSLSLFSVEAAESRDGTLAFALAATHTACLAMDVCLPDGEAESCRGTAGCC